MVEFAWHIHHEVLVEPLTEPIENRIAFIKKTKHLDEIPTRLRLLKKVQGALPKAVVTAAEAYARAYSALEDARHVCTETGNCNCNAAIDAYEIAENSYMEAIALYKVEIEALHATECPDCPWDGTSIFPKKDE